MATWLSDHWQWITGFGAAGGTAASLRWFPSFWRGLGRILASPFIAEIERERRLARDAQVIDLTDEVERLNRRIEDYERRERERGSGGG